MLIKTYSEGLFIPIDKIRPVPVNVFIAILCHFEKVFRIVAASQVNMKI